MTIHVFTLLLIYINIAILLYIIIITIIIIKQFYFASKCRSKLRGRSLHIGRTHDQHFEAFCKGISWDNHRVIGIATNTSMVLNCAVVTYLMMTAEVGLPDVVYISSYQRITKKFNFT